MSVLKTAVGVVGVVVAVGVMSTGVARNPDGTVNIPQTVDQGARAGGQIAGQTFDNGANSLGHGLGSAVGESDLAKMAAGAGGVYGAYKVWRRWGPADRPSVVEPTGATVPPVTQPEPDEDEVQGDDGPVVAPPVTLAPPTVVTLPGERVTPGGLILPPSVNGLSLEGPWSSPVPTWRVPCPGLNAAGVVC